MTVNRPHTEILTVPVSVDGPNSPSSIRVGKPPPLVEHELKMFNYRWAALRAGANLQYWEAKGNLNFSHLTAPLFASCNKRCCILQKLSVPMRCIYYDAKTAMCVSAYRSFILQCVDD